LRQAEQIRHSLPHRTIHDPAGEPFHTRDRGKERTLAGPVRPHDGSQASRSELPAHGLQGYSSAIAHDYVAQQNAAISKTTPLPI
jgi:hypothetical protein